MATKIKDTPVLTGRDAVAFSKAIEVNKTIKVSPTDYRRAQEVFKQIKMID